MDAYAETAYEWLAGLIGPQSVVPWWAWAAALVMIFWGLLAPGITAGRDREEERKRLLS
ncbi:hypothetical protein Asp14428_59230 [Actinoplanes sp. NBRC 14428]|uniref:Uncharacterized protein n=1 Tax=Pseudosporangium ferrugineum TaxID=439699 RepID=A0A2T0SDB4_9ACTN|nr:intracellular growth attenuator family protein [Pseudosporangium ferrugineum]PRY31408.1 hypothetical protein CLV70_103295 [Pseudosporangium ferrugineum]BCJ54448.1 hypothetical protein Asp14428_59230 [Actinoplanes sp. NBRC 14428]